ncbi:uncharacterized protein LOC130897483 [Diorhabda carinulata]|uniref:uncharacterized protein LOC130441801 n=1 Tax=Diorhabda sublineata TaxID=1163346 RepID=UPI0024E11CBF|nr:uncharacterized protein LOC130441801 [Diorhabda sublineata]XP_057662347.1 uncharacterized protein LOC130897483 [Diorhabda carinulata]
MPFGKWAKIGVGWSIVVVAGIYSFYLAKTSVESRRYENMKIRERMRESNVGEYTPSYRKFSTVKTSES